MTTPTINEVIACNDKAQINEWAATICMGWSPPQTHIGIKVYIEPSDFGDLIKVYEEYNPCEDKAQAFDLMVKYGLSPEFSAEGRCWIEQTFQKYIICEEKTTDNMFDGVLISGDIKDILMIITKSAICAKLGE